MNCKKCGKEIEDQYKYCYKCGDTFDMQLKQRTGIIDVGDVQLSPSEKKVVDTIKKYPILGIILAILLVGFLIFLFV